MSKHWEQNKDATVYVGNIDERVTQERLTELMTQVGPVRQVHMPLDRVSRIHQGYGFVEFDTPASAEYAAKTLNGIRLFGKPVRVNKASADKQKTVDIGAELFINNLDPQVDEKILYDTFSQFGQILRQPNIVRDDNNISKGYGFVSFDSFEASDAALSTMNGQYMLSKQITVDYAYKKDGKGERHGDEAERRLAAEGKKHNIVPELQTLPAAYHMTAPAGGGAPAALPVANQPPPHAFNPVAVPVMPVNPGMPGPMGGYGGMPPAPIPMHRGGPPPPFGMGPSMGGPGAGGGNRMGGGGGGGLPPAPSGLPARPPPSQVGFGGPVPFHPPPELSTGPPAVYQFVPGRPVPVLPPGGFMPPAGGPPGGFNGLPNIPPPPGGFPRRS
ncbi:hypothetical protein QBC35DRAFT_517669 [Podospora australis]|uniref:RRM domain-containing protein n=1 Tax=Podospora australis TaxID=1536484 RepID=A0AAN6WLV2_9PEZI|nr:hypothetical protein QBC35DRAFT_517669 [Podospora australis]